MIDQAIVSGASFFTTLIIGRYAGPDQLGLYSLGISVVLALLAVQMSLVTTPYAVHHHSSGDSARRYLGGTLLMQLAMVGFAIVALVVAAGVMRGSTRVILWMLVTVGPLLMVREFARRMAYAQLSVERALAIDIPVALLQIVALIVLAMRGHLRAVTALGILGIAAAFGAVIWLTGARPHADFHRDTFAADTKRHWAFGRWLAGAQLLGLVSTQGTYWLVNAVLGESATGIYAACLQIVLLSNPFILGIGNLLTPRAAQTYARGGDKALRRLIGRFSLVIGGVLSAFCIVVAICGDQVVQLLYGPEYAGHGLVVALLAITFLLGAVAMAVHDGLRSLGRTNIEFASMALDTIITIALGFVGLHWFGLAGLAGASVIGSIAALGLASVVFLRSGES